LERWPAIMWRYGKGARSTGMLRLRLRAESRAGRQPVRAQVVDHPRGLFQRRHPGHRPDARRLPLAGRGIRPASLRWCQGRRLAAATGSASPLQCDYHRPDLPRIFTVQAQRVVANDNRSVVRHTSFADVLLLNLLLMVWPPRNRIGEQPSLRRRERPTLVQRQNLDHCRVEAERYHARSSPPQPHREPRSERKGQMERSWGGDFSTGDLGTV
jgi:hypothetical protein